METKFVSLKRFPHKVGINFWHIEFATKYRYKMFGKFKQQHIMEASSSRTILRADSVCQKVTCGAKEVVRPP